MTSRCWDTTLPALLAAGHAVVTLDHRACGRSDKDFTDTSIAAIASDVVALVEHLGLRSPVLNGWSLGGAVVIEAAARLGSNLAGLVLTGGATPRYTSAEGWPYGGTPADVEGVLAGLAADRASTFRAVAGAVCVKPVGADVVESMWLQFMENGPRADLTLRDLEQIRTAFVEQLLGMYHTRIAYPQNTVVELESRRVASGGGGPGGAGSDSAS